MSQKAERLHYHDPHYYEWETHIFFDDAMTKCPKTGANAPNDFVKLLISQVGPILNIV